MYKILLPDQVIASTTLDTILLTTVEEMLLKGQATYLQAPMNKKVSTKQQSKQAQTLQMGSPTTLQSLMS